MPIRPTKSAHPTYEKCPSDLRKVPIWPTKNAHPTFGKCPSDLRKRPIRPTNVSKRQLKVGRMHQYAVFNVPIRPTVHRTYNSCKNHVFVGRMGSRGDGRRSKNTPSLIWYKYLSVSLCIQWLGPNVVWNLTCDMFTSTYVHIGMCVLYFLKCFQAGCKILGFQVTCLPSSS